MRALAVRRMRRTHPDTVGGPERSAQGVRLRNESNSSTSLRQCFRAAAIVLRLFICADDITTERGPAAASVAQALTPAIDRASRGTQMDGQKKRPASVVLAGLHRRMARPERFELPTTKFVAWYSIQLSYGRVVQLSRGIHAVTGGSMQPRSVSARLFRCVDATSSPDPGAAPSSPPSTQAARRVPASCERFYIRPLSPLNTPSVVVSTTMTITTQR